MTEIWAGMATLLERADSRPRAIESILPQVDRLTVTPGDILGDQAKFCSCEHAPGVYLTVDDDLIYPDSYVVDICHALDKHPGCIVSYHGWTMNAAGARDTEYPCLATVEHEQQVDVIGTCNAVFHTDTIRPTIDQFPGIMADLWLSLMATRLRIPMIVLPHPHDYFAYMEPKRTMWDETDHQTGSSLDATEQTADATRQLLLAQDDGTAA